MENLQNKQTLKKGLLALVKETKGLTDRIFNVRYSNGSYWIYNGLLLSTKIFNLNYAKQYCKIISSSLKTDEVYIVSEITGTQKTLFGL